MSRVHTEEAFGDAIVTALVDAGWQESNNGNYRKELALDTAILFEFIGHTQADAWEIIVGRNGGDRDLAQREFATLLTREIDSRGVLDVLRNGVKDRGVRIKLAYFRPAHTVADDALVEYEQNRLSVIRELNYAIRGPAKELDLGLFVNGIPVATAELKNQLTKSSVVDSMKQYETRDPKELLFAKRTLVHFAVDQNLVFLTTKLQGAKTRFLPFNIGTAGPGNAGGAGNPPVSAGDGYVTAYLWEQIWRTDVWLDLLKRFVHVENHDRSRKSVHDRSIIFPRFHQWHVVRELTAHAAKHGSGTNYLVMHSAGSGKSNSISWLAHGLSTLHASAEPGALDPESVRRGALSPNKPIFDKVIVVTDRSILDRQLQDTIFQFDHTTGVVERITGSSGSKSTEVAAALANTAVKIVIVTLQTFPYLLQGVGSMAGKRVAIIVDEAHSGQSADARKALQNVLRGLGSEDLDADGDPLTASALARGRHPDISYFAFTATPKPKTLELFGVQDEMGVWRAFHIYSMRQAIEESFILDVLPNYITYKTYWKVANANPDDPEVDPEKANAQLARFAYLHDSTLAQHAEIIIEHFCRHTAHRMGRRAKAMVVTRSREGAVRMFHALNKYIVDHDVPDLGVLVAFSGTLKIDEDEVTESQLNNKISESELPSAFAYARADDPHAAARAKPEFRILVVADKYQTGFDQPLLTTMYVEKKLTGVAAVQALSRLNRTHPLKSQEDVFVLDFANEAEDIQKEFRNFYEEAVTTQSDPNLLYSAQHKVLEHQLLVESEMQDFVDALLMAQPGPDEDRRQWEKRHAALYRFTDPALHRYEKLLAEQPDAAEAFRVDLREYLRRYGFLSQILPPAYVDAELERLYLYGKHLLNRVRGTADPRLDIGEVDLTHLRVVKTGEHDVSLTPEGEQMLPGFGTGIGGEREQPKRSPLSEIIEGFNERYGLGLTEADKLMVEERIVAASEDPEFQEPALANSEGAFQHVFDDRFRDIMMERAEASTKFTERFFGDNDFQSALTRDARRAVYGMIRRNHGLSETA
jgi:type I restriction enzyme, R subunit